MPMFGLCDLGSSYCQMLWMRWRENAQAATLSSMRLSLLSWSVMRSPSLKVTPSSTSAMSSWPLKRRQRCWRYTQMLWMGLRTKAEYLPGC